MKKKNNEKNNNPFLNNYSNNNVHNFNKKKIKPQIQNFDKEKKNELFNIKNTNDSNLKNKSEIENKLIRK